VPVAIHLTATGTGLTGSVEGIQPKPVEIHDGKVDGDTITFWLNSDYEGTTYKVVFKGKVSAGQIEFEFGTEEGSWGTTMTAKRAEDAVAKPSAPDVSGTWKGEFDFQGTSVPLTIHLKSAAGVVTGMVEGLPTTPAVGARNSVQLKLSWASSRSAKAAASDAAAPAKTESPAATIAPMAVIAKERDCPLVVRGAGDLESLAAICEKARGAGVEDLVLDPGARDPAGALELFTQLRRLAVKKNVRALGYPLIAFASGQTPEAEAALAAGAIAKYAGVLVLDHDDPALLYPLMTLRQNIYTDPQKPIQVEPGLYSIGAVTADSPLLITTNFSLTYFTVSGEVESGGTPAHLLVADADGQSVLTSWAAGKFDAEKIAKTVLQSGIGDRLTHRKLVIPGLVAGLSGETEEELPGWQIIVGPREAVEIPTYLKTVWPRL